MPARNTPITKIRRLAKQLASEIPTSILSMSKNLGLSRTTIRDYKLRINKIGFSFKDFAALSSNEMQRVLWQQSECRIPTERYKKLLTIFPDVERCMIEGHTNLKTAWAEYRICHPFGYGYSQFAANFRSWLQTHGVGSLSLKKWAVRYLSEEDMIVLKKWRRSNNRLLWAKAVTILDSHQGTTIVNLCLKLEKGRRIIERWINAFRDKGLDGLRSPQERNQSSEMLEEMKKKRDHIVEILHESPQLHNINRASWSLVTLSCAYEAQFGEPIGRSTISEYVRAEGYAFRKARRVLTSPDPDYRKKLAEITKILSSLGEDEKFFSVDEFGPFSVKMQGGRTYTPIGTTRVVPQWQRSRGQLILTGALELSTNQLTHFYSEKKNTDEMIKLLEILLEQYYDQRCIYLSWDAASWHISAKLAKRVKEVNAAVEGAQQRQPIVKLAPLPSSAQFLNVIEPVFSGMAKAVLHNSDYQTVEECKAAIDTYITDRNEHYKQHPKRAGNKIWGKEQVEPSFKSSNNCKNPRWR
jgi:transposase